MIVFFEGSHSHYALETDKTLSDADLGKLNWLFGNGRFLESPALIGFFIGPRKEMITPWSTNAVEIMQNMGINGITRIEEFFSAPSEDAEHDPMLQVVYNGLGQDIFEIVHDPEPVVFIEDIGKYNEMEGLALSEEEIEYLKQVSSQLGRDLTDSEVFGFSQVNSEHCRHKIFNGTFLINGSEQEMSLFQLIKKTSRENPGRLVSAYSDNVAFVKGPAVLQFAPATQDTSDYFELNPIDSILSLKAETHNFPTTVEPFNGAATGSGGEIRDRMAGGKASIPLAGTAVYITSYPRLAGGRDWEKNITARKWLYQSPDDILVKASNGASDFGNKFGQPLISGSLLTFEHAEHEKMYGFDKVIMLAGGIGFANNEHSHKSLPEEGDKIIMMGGDNYRIGMGGGAVSSVATGEYDNRIELNAIQRSNPEMQKRVYNVIRAMAEASSNPIVSIHDHGAGGHLNCFSELVENTGGNINIGKLPVGDPTLSDREILGNESQERMGLIIKEEDIDLMNRVSARERSPFYVVGEVTNDKVLKFLSGKNGQNPIDWKLEYLFGSSPRTILEDTDVRVSWNDPHYDVSEIGKYIEWVLQLEAVACKDWLTNKVDRSVTGKVAKQQTAGNIQLPLNNVGVMTLDYTSNKGIATSIGHAPVAGLSDPEAGSILSITESLTNLVWAPVEDGLKGVSLSANWMWPAKNPGENARLYRAVEAVSAFAIQLGVNVPTGKDSLSMTQKYPDQTVYAPGTVIISTVGEVTDVNKVVEPVLVDTPSSLIYVDMSLSDFELGGSSFHQVFNKVGSATPQVSDAGYFAKAFEAIQELVEERKVLAGHDVSAGGLITCLLEMCFAGIGTGLNADLGGIGEEDLVKILFSEKPSVVIQVEDPEATLSFFSQQGVNAVLLGQVTSDRSFNLGKDDQSVNLNIDDLRDIWFRTSWLLDVKQSGNEHADLRFRNYKTQALEMKFPAGFSGTYNSYGLIPDRREKSGVKCAIIREKGVNGDREMAYSLFLAGFDVKDVHMTDLITGRETLEDVNMIVFVGGFSNSDVLGSAKGWAGAFLYNPRAKEALDKFYQREDTLSLGVCNGCQLMMELDLVYPELQKHPKMDHNASGKFESAFVNVDIPENNSVMFSSLAGSKLGIWVAHGEGRFRFGHPESDHNIVAKYSYEEYPGNPNGSEFNAAAVCSANGRHLAIMPHLERSIFPYHWAYYPQDRQSDEITPWVEAFVNARKWIQEFSS